MIHSGSAGLEVFRMLGVTSEDAGPDLDIMKEFPQKVMAGSER